MREDRWEESGHYGGVGIKATWGKVWWVEMAGRERLACLAVNALLLLLGDAFSVLDKANWQTQATQSLGEGELP